MTNPFPPPPGGDKAEAKSAADASPAAWLDRAVVLQELIRAQRTLRMYPEGHPQREGILAQSFSAISPLLGKYDELSFEVGRKGFSYRQQPVGEKNLAFPNFAHELHLRQIKKFAFRTEMSLEEFDAFLQLISLEAEAFRGGKLVEQHFRRKKVRGIWVNEIDFGRLRGGEEWPEEPEEEADEPREDEPVEELLEEDPGGVKERIRALIASLDAEVNPDRFLERTRELEVFAAQLTREEQYEAAWMILAALSDHADHPEGRPEACRQHALRSVKALTQRRLLDYLLEEYTVAPETRRRPFERVFRQIGLGIMDPVLALIGRNEALYSHRRLLEFLVEMGAPVREPLEKHLAAAAPNLARKIVYLLGELRRRESLEVLRTTLGHPDLRLRKEAVRALAKLRSAESSRALVEVLTQRADMETKILTVQTLGETRDLSAVPALVKLLTRRSWLDDQFDLLEAAAQALGHIGSREAVPALIKTLHRGKLFSVEANYRLRTAAAAALGRLGGEAAAKALERLLKGKDDPLEAACREALAQCRSGGAAAEKTP